LVINQKESSMYLSHGHPPVNLKTKRSDQETPVVGSNTSRRQNVNQTNRYVNNIVIERFTSDEIFTQE
jgi:hypothetical protein